MLLEPVDQSVRPMSFRLWWRCVYIQSIEWSSPVMKCLPTGKLQASEATAYTPCGGKTIAVKLANYTHLCPQFEMVYVRLAVCSCKPVRSQNKQTMYLLRIYGKIISGIFSHFKKFGYLFH